MRVAFFGSGSPLSVIALTSLARRHEVVAVVVPERRLGRRDRVRKLFGRLADDPLTKLAHQGGIAAYPFRRDRMEDLRSALAEKRIGLIVVATFPSLIPSSVLNVATRGGVNLHQSRLPRGRGPDPIFWAYYDDDREIGSTVHWLDEAFDRGDIITQESMPIGRGRSGTELYYDLAELGARQLVDSIDAIEHNSATRTPQDESLATHRPSPLKTQWRVPFDVWPAERTWHFLAGVGDMFGSLSRDPRGEPLPMGAATAYSNESHHRPAGTYERTADGLRLYCPDGVVDVKGARSGRLR